MYIVPLRFSRAACKCIHIHLETARCILFRLKKGSASISMFLHAARPASLRPGRAGLRALGGAANNYRPAGQLLGGGLASARRCCISALAGLPAPNRMRVCINTRVFVCIPVHFRHVTPSHWRQVWYSCWLAYATCLPRRANWLFHFGTRNSQRSRVCVYVCARVRWRVCVRVPAWIGEASRDGIGRTARF